MQGATAVCAFVGYDVTRRVEVCISDEC
jgi:hypothetical protein